MTAILPIGQLFVIDPRYITAVTCRSMLLGNQGPRPEHFHFVSHRNNFEQLKLFYPSEILFVHFPIIYDLKINYFSIPLSFKVNSTRWRWRKRTIVFLFKSIKVLSNMEYKVRNKYANAFFERRTILCDNHFFVSGC